MTTAGDVFRRRGQQYRCLDTEPYYNHFDRLVVLRVLVSDCADCGAPFRLKATEAAIRKGSLNRRCQRHKRPGVKVKTVRPAKRSRRHRRCN